MTLPLRVASTAALFAYLAFATTAASAASQSPRPRPVIAQQHDGLRCGNRLVELQATKADVIGRCGEPLSKDQHVESRGRPPQVVVVNIEEWTYKPDNGSFTRLLRFENNRLVSVQALAK